jgi:hypothetical protein
MPTILLIITVFKSIASAKENYSDTKSAAKTTGFHINANKTKIIIQDRNVT